MTDRNPIRHGEVYLPGETPPDGGGKQPFFAHGGFKTLLVLIFFFCLAVAGKVTGATASIKDWIGSILFGWI